MASEEGAKLSLCEGQCSFCVSVLLQLASEALPNDMTLALAYLLALPQVCWVVVVLNSNFTLSINPVFA